MKIIFKNFWKGKINYLPLLHISIQVDIYKYQLDFGLLGFCLIFEF